MLVWLFGCLAFVWHAHNVRSLFTSPLFLGWVAQDGNRYLQREFPKLSWIKSTKDSRH